MNDLIQTVAVYALPVLFAITLHEAAHAYAAKYFGDSTAYQQGRMSLNPIKHIDPFGTILIPIMLYFATGGAFLFGYAKPVPVDFGKLRNPKKQMALGCAGRPGRQSGHGADVDAVWHRCWQDCRRRSIFHAHGASRRADQSGDICSQPVSAAAAGRRPHRDQHAAA